MKYFSHEKLKAAANGVKPYAECTIPQGEQNEQLAKNLVKAVSKLCQEEDPKVVFLVRSMDLFSVPGVESSITPMDTGSVGARLLNMEVSIDALSTSVEQMRGLGQSVDTLAKVVTGLQGQLKSLPVDGVVQQQQVGPATVVQVQEQTASRSYAAVAGRGPSQSHGATTAEAQRKRKRDLPSGASPVQETPKRPNPATPPSALFQAALVQNGVRGISQMLREERERSDELQQEGFTLASGNRRRQRRQAKLLQGESEVQAGGSLPSPFSVFIRNTDPNYGEDDIKKYLVECAAAMPAEEKLQCDLQVLQVRNIPIKHNDGAPLRSKCWKVTVDQKFKEHMLKARAYPSSWSARQWYGSSSQQTRSGLKVVAGADPSGAYCRPASKRFGPPGLYGGAAVEGTEPLASKAGGPKEPQVPQPHTEEGSLAQLGPNTVENTELERREESGTENGNQTATPTSDAAQESSMVVA